MGSVSWAFNAHYDQGCGFRGSKGPNGVSLKEVVQFAPFLFCNMALTKSGDVYVVGNNGFAQHALGIWSPSPIPQWTKVPLGGKVKAIVACNAHPLILMRDGTCRTWVTNVHGLRGTGTHPAVEDIPGGMREAAIAKELYAIPPQKVVFPAGTVIVAVACGDKHNLALDSTGQPWGWGIGAPVGRPGEDMLIPTKITGLPKIVAIAAGEGTSFFLDAEGHVFGCGQNQHGELGNPNGKTREPVTQMPGITEAVAIAAGGHHTHIKLRNGDVLSCGQNLLADLGLGPPDKEDHPVPTRVELPGPVDYIATGPCASPTGVADMSSAPVFVIIGGKLFAWGSNRFGQIDKTTNGPGAVVSAPTLIPMRSAVLNVIASEYTASAVLAGESPPPPMSATLAADESSLTLTWSWPESSGEWQARVSIEPSEQEEAEGVEPPKETVKLGKAAQSCTIPLEPHRGYSVVIRQSGSDSMWDSAIIDTALLPGGVPFICGVGPWITIEPANLSEIGDGKTPTPPKVGLSAIAMQGKWGRETFTYTFQWFRDGKPLTAKGRRYTFKASDVGHTLSVKVTATNPSGSATAMSESTATVAP